MMALLVVRNDFTALRVNSSIIKLTKITLLIIDFFFLPGVLFKRNPSDHTETHFYHKENHIIQS